MDKFSVGDKVSFQKKEGKVRWGTIVNIDSKKTLKILQCHPLKEKVTNVFLPRDMYEKEDFIKQISTINKKLSHL